MNLWTIGYSNVVRCLNWLYIRKNVHVWVLIKNCQYANVYANLFAKNEDFIHIVSVGFFKCMLNRISLSLYVNSDRFFTVCCFG